MLLLVQILLVCRYAVTGDSESVTFTAAVKGTAAYMPPEAINCDVSAKWDTWSYGVVILELITGEYVMCSSTGQIGRKTGL